MCVEAASDTELPLEAQSKKHAPLPWDKSFELRQAQLQGQLIHWGSTLMSSYSTVQ